MSLPPNIDVGSHACGLLAASAGQRVQGVIVQQTHTTEPNEPARSSRHVKGLALLS